MNVESAPVAMATAGAYQVDDLLVDVRVRRVTRDGLELDVADRSFDLLLALVRATPNLMSIQELMDCVWSGVVVGPETVTQRVKLLRQSLGDSAETPRYIAAMRGHGYRMAAPVTPLAAAPRPVTAAPSALAAVAGAAELAATRPQPAPWMRRWSLALLAALLIGAGAAWWRLEHRVGGQVADIGAAPPKSAVVAPSSVAVMPFANLTGDPGKDYLGDGMAEELINTLAKVPGLKVPGRTSAFSFRQRNVDIRQIGKDLGVATVLEGSVRSAGQQLRISARLVDAASGYQIWSQDYDRQSADIFRLQDDLAEQIVQALRGYMKVALVAPPERSPPSTNVEAYQLYLQARSVSRGTDPSEQQASVLLDQALALDPDFAQARGDRAIIVAGAVALSGAPARLLEGAQRDATRALAVNPNSPNANTAQEMIYAVRGNWVAAQGSFRAAMIDGATDPILRTYHSMILLRPVGKLRQARAELAETYRLAPNDGFTVHELALTDSLLGQDADAVRLSGLSEEIAGTGGPPHTDVFLVHARAAGRAGRYAEATERAVLALPESLRTAGGREAIQAFYAALADPAQRPEALRALRGFVPTLKGKVLEGRTRMFFVDALAMMGALDAAYELAMWCVDQRADTPGSIDWSDVWMPEMRPFRQDPRFQTFVARLRLIDYWKRFGPPDDCTLNANVLACR